MVPALRGLRQEDSMFEARLDSVLKCCLRKIDINLDGRCLRQDKPCFPCCPRAAGSQPPLPLFPHRLLLSADENKSELMGCLTCLQGEGFCGSRNCTLLPAC